uniref:Putative ixodes 10 kDa peptide protein n=1 Tax=Ixodes ricinus TaxID=34613 RepID=A0A0K8RJ51_IXORI
MCRNISNMLFVLFAVVLGLAASEGEGFLLADNRCYLSLMRTGKEYCQLLGYDNFSGLDYDPCKIGCDDTNVPLPEEACPNGRVQNPCTDEDVKRLQTWADTLESQKAKVQGKLCK